MTLTVMHMKPSKILITGGVGFLGSHLVDRAVEEGFDVTVIDNLSRGNRTQGPFNFIKGDVNDPADVEKLEPADIVVHCAALCGVEKVITYPDQIIDDFIGTYNICRYAGKNNVSHLLFLSSGEIYGSNAINSHEENDVTLWNTHIQRTNYALSKLMGEAIVRTQQVPFTIIRPFNVFGPRQTGSGVVNNFFRRAIKNRPLEIYNTGQELRAMCYIDDFIQGCFNAVPGKT